MSATVYSQTPCSIPEDLNIKCHIQEYGHKQMSRGFTVYMVFVFDFLNAETKLLSFRDKHTNITSKQMLYVNVPFYVLDKDKIHYSIRHSIGLF